MKELSEQTAGIRSRFHASLWLPASVLGGLVIITLVTQVVLSWRVHEHLAPVSKHAEQMIKLQGANLALQKELVESLHEDGKFTAKQRENMSREIQEILDSKVLLEEKTPQLLMDSHHALSDTSLHPREALILALSHMREAISLEGRAHQKLIENVNRTTSLELEIGTITLLLFTFGAILLIYLLRRRILAPLDRLGFLMTLLMRRDYSPAPISTIDPILRPLTENYNAMVERLAELEKDHVVREQDLENQVQNATRALLDQQRSLANAERLAAVGDMMARIAHELRNPMAGIKLACMNLRQELNQMPGSSDYVERIRIVGDEIDRINAVLNSLLDQSRHSPEPLRDVNLAQAVTDLIALVRFQIPGYIRLEQRISRDIVCRLPDALLRQALLNLLLNAQQAIGEQDGLIVVDADIESGILHLSVIDDGPGFPQDILAAGIRAFVTHRPEGTGLGLSMVERFVRAQGGSVELSNVEPHGAFVRLELPCGRSNV